MSNDLQQEIDELDKSMREGDQPEPQAAPEAPAPEIQAPAPQQVEEYELTVNGKPIKANREQVLKWASMGYNAPTTQGTLKKQIDQMKSQIDQYKSYDETYKPIDEWAKKNPEKWKELFYTWQTGQHNTQFAQLPPDVLQKLDQTQTLMNSLLQEREQQKIQAEDQALDTEISTIKKDAKEKWAIDLDRADDTGKTGEQKVLEYAHQNGIPTFAAAFKVFYHDDLVRTAEERGKTAVNNGLQKQARDGFIGKTPTPTKGITSPQNIRARGYNDLANEAVEELVASGWRR